MPDGTVPSSTEALRAALSAARASLERQLRATRTDATEDALRQVKSALCLLPSERISDIPEIEWVEASPALGGEAGAAMPMANAETIASHMNEAAATRAADDLTRIRGIDDVLAKRLAALGIQRYAQIAAWQPDDVRVIADAMGLGRRFIAMGIVEQASELERAQTEARYKEQQGPVSPTAEGRHSVAIWEPKASAAIDTTAPLVRAPTAWKPLNGDTLAAVLKIIRTKRPMNVIVTLGDVAPVLTQPIYIATDYDAATELPRWRTGVLVPFVEAREGRDLLHPDLMQLARSSRQAATPAWPTHRDAMPVSRASQPSEAANAIAAFHMAVAATSAPQPAKVQPLHEQASSRIDDLEAELEQMAERSSAQNARPTNVDVASVHRPRRMAEPPLDRAATPMFGTRDDVPEADVRIVVDARSGVRAKAPLLAPLPDLPLTTRSRAHVRHAGKKAADARQNSGQVEEAAVVIVRRTTAEPAAAGLAFYAQSQAQPSTGLRRFMRALAGG